MSDLTGVFGAGGVARPVFTSDAMVAFRLSESWPDNAKTARYAAVLLGVSVSALKVVLGAPRQGIAAVVGVPVENLLVFARMDAADMAATR